MPADLRGRAALGLVATAWLFLRVGEVAGGAPAWARSWGDDLLCLPVVLPRLGAATTADPWDPPAYLAGWLFFQYLLNRPGTSGRLIVATAS